MVATVLPLSRSSDLSALLAMGSKPDASRSNATSSLRPSPHRPKRSRLANPTPGDTACPDAALARAEIVVVGHADADTRQRIIAVARNARVVDLNGYADLRAAGFAQYEGICW